MTTAPTQICRFCLDVPATRGDACTDCQAELDYINPATWPNAAAHPAAVEALAGALGQIWTPHVRADAKPRDLAIAAVEILAMDGRLLPDGGETREEWEVRWHAGDSDGIRYHEAGFPNRENAGRRGPQMIGNHGITWYSLHCREHRIFEDGSSWSGPWVEVTDGDS